MIRVMNNRTAYHPVAKFIHWSIVILIAVQFVSGWPMPLLRYSDTPNYFKITHLSLGLSVIPFAAALYYMRFSKPVARPEMDTASNLLKLITTGTHYLLYILLVLVPISGWASASIRGMKIGFFDIFNLPLTQIDSSTFLHLLGGVHGEIAELMGFVAVCHILASLYHHFILKDSVLNRMRPGGRV